MNRFAFFLVVIVFTVISSCADDDIEKTPQEKIIGTWIGVEFPEHDTIIFWDNNKAQTSGRGSSGGTVNYSIDNTEINFFSGSNSGSRHSYEFLPNDRIYIDDMIPTVGFEPKENGIEFQKIK